MVDNIIEKILSASSDPEILSTWERRKSNYKAHLESKKVKGLECGDYVDIRDTEHIWCKAEVKMKIESVG